MCGCSVMCWVFGKAFARDCFRTLINRQSVLSGVVDFWVSEVDCYCSDVDFEGVAAQR